MERVTGMRSAQSGRINAHERAARTASRRWLRAMLAALVLATLHIGALRSALGMECPRTATPLLAVSVDAAAPTWAATVPGDTTPDPALASACASSAWVSEMAVAVPTAFRSGATALVLEARPRPDPSLRPPFHPPRPV